MCYKLKTASLCLAFTLLFACAHAYQRQRISLDEGWSFAFGHAADPLKDFGCGTEYFTYLTKAASIHNIGPYSLDFQEDSTLWKKVDLPHDFAAEVPFSSEASHSHGYKCVGWRYPETSVGWYRRTFTLSPEDRGGNIRVQFDGIFREGQVWVNGIYLGRRDSGYISHDYDITPYLFYDGRENLITVRCDASIEEGWFYEGAGIYRHAWLQKTGELHIDTDGIFAHSRLLDNYSRAEVTIETEIVNDGPAKDASRLEYQVFDPSGKVVARASSPVAALGARKTFNASVCISLDEPLLWSTDEPNLYNVVVEIVGKDGILDSQCVRTGLREVRIDPDHGLFLNGKPLKLKGFNMHQDHAGVGAAIPDGLHRYRLARLKWMGANAYRASHNPSSRELLDAGDELGMLVIEENRLLGINPASMDVAADMIRRSRNHPCIFTWSIGNEEWGLEWDPRSVDIGAAMTEMFHAIDPTRPVCVASSSGPAILKGVDIAGYNYIRQHHIDSLKVVYPQRIAIGTEETTGCGTRGIYFNELPLAGRENEYDSFLAANPSGRMPALGRFPDSDGTLNRIERGWKFYQEREWLSGVFFWTGFDYRGEPNPLAYPATGSEFGVLDYCGFPKDEAYYLKAWWRPDEPLVHILPHWNLSGHEGEIIPVWVYSNCEKVELRLNGKSLGVKKMPRNGHLEWQVKYAPGRIEAIGCNRGRKAASECLRTSSQAAQIRHEVFSWGNLHIIDFSVYDSDGNFVPDACVDFEISTSGLIGWGNGDPCDKHCGEPASGCVIRTFNGHAQAIVQAPNEDFHLEIKFK